MSIEPKALALALVRIGEPFIYDDVLADRQPVSGNTDLRQQALLCGILKLGFGGRGG